MGHIDNEVRGVSYGVVYNVDSASAFDYLCGVEVTASGHRPDDCVELNVPPRTYAVFQHTGHISTIEATFREIWERGLADAGARAAEGPVLERYDERYDPRTGLGGFEILVPVVT
jgi:AraC family transcriptional regulator